MSAPERVATVTHLPARPQDTDAAPPVPAVVEPRQPRITLGAVKDAVTPPDIWSDDRPSLRKLWLYGVYGRWTRATGPVRVAGVCWASLALVVHGVLYIVGWTFERPSRFFVAATVAALIKLAL